MCIYIYLHWLKRPVGEYPDERSRRVFRLIFPMLFWEFRTRESIRELQSNKTLELERAMEKYSSYTWACKIFLVSELLFPTKIIHENSVLKKWEFLPFSTFLPPFITSASLLLPLTFFPLPLAVPEAPSLKVVTVLTGLSKKSSSSKGQQLWTGTYDHRNNSNYPFRPTWGGVGWEPDWEFLLLN